MNMDNIDEREAGEAENYWFDGPRMSKNEKDVNNLLEWYEYWHELNYYKNRDCELFVRVRDFHRGPFQGKPRDPVPGLVHRTLEIPHGVAMYAWNTNLTLSAINEGLSLQEFYGLAWRRYLLGAERKLPLRDGSGVSSVYEVFVDEFMKVEDRWAREDVDAMYCLMLAGTMSGIVGEFVALDILDEQLPDAVVRRAEKDEERRDTDILVNGYRISVKCGGAFTENEFKKYAGHGVAVYVGFPAGVRVLDATLKDLCFKFPKGDSYETYSGLEGIEQIELRSSKPELIAKRTRSAILNYKSSRSVVSQKDDDDDPFDGFDDEVAASLVA